jgi:hypothetical protein
MTALPLRRTVEDGSFREGVWKSHGAGPSEVAELLAYAQNAFSCDALAGGAPLPWDDALSVASWAGYVAEAERVGACEVLRTRLVQLRFPIQAGISGRAEYLAATRQGRPFLGTDGVGWTFRDPDGLRLFVHPTPVGRIPVLVASAREDFVALVRALTRRNEPDAIPDSMGACIVSGYNNWDRVRERYREWNGAGIGEAGRWDAFLREIGPRREYYQDRFILLSRGFYSATPPSDVGLEPEAWMERSLALRLEHEATHFLTARMFGSMRNSLLDELLADYMGLLAAFGRYRADLFLRFVGLEGSGDPGQGRLALYRGKPALSDGAFRVLGSATRASARALEGFDSRYGAPARCVSQKVREAVAIALVGLEGLASARALALLEEAWRAAGVIVPSTAAAG